MKNPAARLNCQTVIAGMMQKIRRLTDTLHRIYVREKMKTSPRRLGADPGLVENQARDGK
jgi:hypothetical protein